jgi:hypothetical protein
VAYFSRKHFPAEINYKIYDNKLLTITWAFKEWRPLPQGFPLIIVVISDHRNPTHVTTNSLLSYRQTRSSEFLSRFEFKIDYWPGKEHGKADALSYQGQVSDEDSNLQEVYHTQTLLKSQNLGLLGDIPPPKRGPTV